MSKPTSPLIQVELAGTRHVIVPENMYGSPELKSGRRPGQSYFAGARFDEKDFWVGQKYVRLELELPDTKWDSRNPFYAADYRSLSIGQLVVLNRLHAIKDDTRGSFANQMGHHMMNDDPDSANALRGAIDVGNFDPSTDYVSRLYLLGRILNYYEDHYLTSDDLIDNTVLFLFLCEVGLCERRSKPLSECEIPEKLAQFCADSRKVLRNIDEGIKEGFLHAAEAQLSSPHSQTAGVPDGLNRGKNELDQIKTPGSVNYTRLSQPAGATLDLLASKANELKDPALSSLFHCFDEMYHYAVSHKHVPKKYKAAIKLLEEQLASVRSLFSDPSDANITGTQQKLIQSVKRPEYRCLTESKGWKLIALNALLVVPLVGWTVACLNRLFTGSFCFRSQGGQRRKTLENVVTKNPTIFAYLKNEESTAEASPTPE